MMSTSVIMAVGDLNIFGRAPNFLSEKYICIHPKTNKAHIFGTSILMPSLFHINTFVAKFKNDSKNKIKTCCGLRLKL